MLKKLALITLIVLLLPLTVFAQGEDEPNFVVSPDGSFAVLLPQGWVAEFDGDTGNFASSQEAFDAVENSEEDIPVLPSGELAMQVSAFSTEFLSLMELEPDASLAEFMSAFLTLIDSAENPLPELTVPEEIEFLPGRTAAISRASENGGEIELVTYNLAPDTLAFAVLFGPEGELFSAEEDTLALLEGILYSVPLDETYEDDNLEINYPASWEAAQVQAGVYTVTNVPEKLEEDGGPLESGEYIMAIYDLTEFNVEDGELPDLLTAVGQDLLEEDEEDSFTEPVQIPLEDRELYGMTVIQADEGENGGGILITRAPTGEILAIVYASVVGQETLVSWTAANMLLQVDVKQ